MRMLCCPARMPLRASSRLLGGTRKVSRWVAASRRLSLEIARWRRSAGKRVRRPCQRFSVSLSAKDSITGTVFYISEQTASNWLDFYPSQHGLRHNPQITHPATRLRSSALQSHPECWIASHTAGKIWRLRLTTPGAWKRVSSIRSKGSFASAVSVPIARIML